MGFLLGAGVRPGDFEACLFPEPPDPPPDPPLPPPPPPERPACQRIYLGYFLLPKLERQLTKAMKGVLTPPVPGPPQPFPAEAGLLSLGQLLGDPDPQPNITAKLRLDTTVQFRTALKKMVTQLDRDIARLQQLP